ncbi:type II secretion system protein E (plasmid) [Burkholderia sp. MS455]|uniref:ATPase, T2SS/T4P/T4SS family n=1 Tax=Burkholderia sp. MS455 TaxID=2811788 RepID=UPI001958CAAD|nr:ATPase, T2SS/T4P/T4SS family [Burkholderia sp. MS455]QRR11786.1 type II secretion system protein E [Burkholderia sp. MS455]
MKSPRTLMAADTMALIAPDVSASSPVNLAQEHGTRPDRVDVPEHLQASVVVAIPSDADRAESVVMLQIDHRVKSSAAVRTWLKRLDELAISYRTEFVTVDALERARREHVSVRRSDPTQTTQARALSLLSLAAAAGASDVHIFVRRWHTDVQVRINGDLYTSDEFSMHAEEGRRLRGAIFQGLATNKPPELKPLDFQDAQIDGEKLAGTGLSTVRIIRGPCVPIEHGGEFLVARLQRRPGLGTTMSRRDALRALRLRTPTRPEQPENDPAWKGFAPAQIDRLRRIAHRPNGLVALTGPTGSGKTQAIFHMERYLAQRFPERRQIAIEDPPEFEKEWGGQLVVGVHSYMDLLRETLRMDPNTLMIGELRAPDEAHTALEAALTGRLVLTTLHVIDPYYFFERLEDMDPERLSRRNACNPEKVIAVIGMRLLPRLCEHCRVPLVDAADDAVPDEVLRALNTWGDTLNVHVRGPGCEHCDGLGTVGRVVAAEIIEMDVASMANLRTLPVDEVKRRHRARPDADYSMLAYAVANVLAGRVDPNAAQSQLSVEARNGERLPTFEELAS